MANIPHTQVKIGGVALTATAATAGPDTVSPSDRVALLVHNRSAAPITVTVTVPGNTRYGQAHPDVTSESIPAASIGAVGPLPADLGDPSDGLVDVTASASTDVDFYAIKV